MESTIFKTEIVNGKCPNCNFDVVLISLASDHFRCTTCGSDLEQKINVLESKSSADYSAQIAVLEEKVAAIESHEHNMAEHGHTKILVNEKQIELLQLQIEEIKVSTSNPLAN